MNKGMKFTLTRLALEFRESAFPGLTQEQKRVARDIVRYIHRFGLLDGKEVHVQESMFPGLDAKIARAVKCHISEYSYFDVSVTEL